MKESAIEINSEMGEIEFDINLIYVIPDEYFASIQVNFKSNKIHKRILLTPSKDHSEGDGGEPKLRGLSSPVIIQPLIEDLDIGSPTPLSEATISINNHLEGETEEDESELYMSDIFPGTPSNTTILADKASKFNRELLKTTCQVMGCRTIHGHLISEEIFIDINTKFNKLWGSPTTATDESDDLIMNVCSIKHSKFTNIIKKKLIKYEYIKPQYLNDFTNAWQFIDRKINVVVLLGGSSGTGKSSLASLLASRLGISNVLSSDTIRHILRNFVEKEENPLLFASTYECRKFMDKEEGKNSEKKLTINGFRKQCSYVHNALLPVIDKIISRNESVVIEGVHLTVDFMKLVMKKHTCVIPFMVIIKNESKHKERFAVRSKHMTLDPMYNKYIDNFIYIRILHKFLSKKAEKSLVPKIDNTLMDKSLGLIHSTIVRCLRKIVKNIALYDATTRKCTKLYQEFNVINKNHLSSREAQQFIQSKVNKGEIMRRFLQDMGDNGGTGDGHTNEEEGIEGSGHSLDNINMNTLNINNREILDEGDTHQVVHPHDHNELLEVGQVGEGFKTRSEEGGEGTEDEEEEATEELNGNMGGKKKGRSMGKDELKKVVMGEEEGTLSQNNQEEIKRGVTMGVGIPVEEERKEKLHKTRSQEHLKVVKKPTSKKIRKKGHRGFTFGKGKIPIRGKGHEEMADFDEENHSIYSGVSGFCSVVSGSILVDAGHGKTDEASNIDEESNMNTSQRAEESHGEESISEEDLEEDEDSDADSIHHPANRASSEDEQGIASDSDEDRQVRNELRAFHQKSPKQPTNEEKAILLKEKIEETHVSELLEPLNLDPIFISSQ